MTIVRGALAVIGLTVAMAMTGCGAPATSAPATAPSTVPSSAATPATASASQSASSGSGSGQPSTGRIAVPEKGYAITLPAGWTRIDFSRDDLVDQVIAAGGDAGYASQFPSLKAQLLGAGLTVFALRRPDSNIPKGTTLTIQDDAIEAVSLDTYGDYLKTQLQTALGPEAKIVSGRLSVSAGEILRLAYETKGANPASNFSYIFLKPARQITINCASPVGPTIEEECDTIALSLEVSN